MKTRFQFCPEFLTKETTSPAKSTRPPAATKRRGGKERNEDGAAERPGAEFLFRCGVVSRGDRRVEGAFYHDDTTGTTNWKIKLRVGLLDNAKGFQDW